MNKLFTILLIQILFIVSIFSQSPIGTLGNKWTFEGWSEGSGWEPNWQGNCQGNSITYETIDEVSINGKTCGIITSNKSNDSLIVYQESGIVYFYENSQFFKLFDFNASIGDTITSFRPSIADDHSLKDFFGSPVEEFISIDTIYTLITDLDTTTINDQKLKRWATEPIYSETNGSGSIRRYETIIENIGSMNGILGDHDLFIGSGCFGGFVCYESQEFQFGSYFFPMCDFSSSINEQEKGEIKIFPNPTSGKLSIEMSNSEISRIEVFNLKGQKLFESLDNNLSINSYEAGVYIIRITDIKNNVVVSKVIKHDL